MSGEGELAKRAGKRPTAKAAPAAGALRQRVIAAALDLAARQGWERVALADIASAAGIKLSELHALFCSKTAILAGLARDIDSQVLDNLPAAEAEASPRDRLFDVLMRRFDALEPHRAGLEAVLRASPRDPLGALCGLASLVQSMTWMLEAAGVPATGLRGLARAKALALLYVWVLRTWLSDESPDKARTMAALDGGLRRARAFLRTAGRPRTAAAG